MNGPSLELIVAAAVPIVPARYRRLPMTDPLDIAHEMRMVKTALLYGDHVSVASWRVAMVRAWSRARSARHAGDAIGLLKAVTAVQWARQVSGVRELPPRFRALEDVAPNLLKVEHVLRELGPEIEIGEVLLDAAMRTKAWRELVAAEELGLVDIREMGMTSGFGFSREAAIAEYLRLLADCTAADSLASPMLDYSSAGVLEVGRAVGLLRGPPRLPTAEIGLVAHYLGYVPAMVDADLASVVRARKSLRGPLVRFRGAISELAKEVEGLPGLPGFDTSADDLYRREVAPRIAEVETLARERGLFRTMRAEVVESQGGLLAKTVVGLAAASVAGLPELAQAAVAGFVGAAEVAGGILKRRRSIGQQLESNELVWIYEAERALTAARDS